MVKREVIAATLGVLAISYALQAKAEILVIPGSGASEYILGELAKSFNGQQTLYKVVIPPTTGTAGALREVTEGNTSIGRVGRPLKDSELKTGLTYLPLGRDPVAFVGGSGVTVRNITRTQMTAAYHEKLANWHELGGKPGIIRAIGREPTDSSCQAIARDMKEFCAAPFVDTVKVVHLDSHMIELLDRFPNSLGFLNRSALSAAKTKVVIFSLDGIAPSSENLESERYPFWTELGLVYKESALTAGSRAFLKFIESPTGIQLLRSNGILPKKPGH